MFNDPKVTKQKTLILVVLLALSFFTIYYVEFQPCFLQGDEIYQTVAGENLLTGHGYSVDFALRNNTMYVENSALTHWPPGYSLCYAGLRSLGCDRKTAATLFRAMSFILGMIIWWRVLKLLNLTPSVFVLAIIYTELCFLYYMVNGITDIAEFCVAGVTVLYIVKLWKHNTSIKDTLLLSVTMSAGILFRFHALFWVPSAVLLTAYYHFRRKEYLHIIVRGAMLMVIPTIAYLIITHIISRNGSMSRTLGWPVFYGNLGQLYDLFKILTNPFTAISTGIPKYLRHVVLIITPVWFFFTLLRIKQNRVNMPQGLLLWSIVTVSCNIVLLYLTMLFWEQPRLESTYHFFAYIYPRYYVYMYPLFFALLLKSVLSISSTRLMNAILIGVFVWLVYLQVQLNVLNYRSAKDGKKKTEQIVHYLESRNDQSGYPVLALHDDDIFKYVSYKRIIPIACLHDLMFDYIKILTGEYTVAQPTTIIVILKNDAVGTYQQLLNKRNMRLVHHDDYYTCFEQLFVPQAVSQ